MVALLERLIIFRLFGLGYPLLAAEPFILRSCRLFRCSPERPTLLANLSSRAFYITFSDHRWQQVFTDLLTESFFALAPSTTSALHCMSYSVNLGPFPLAAAVAHADFLLAFADFLPASYMLWIVSTSPFAVSLYRFAALPSTAPLPPVPISKPILLEAHPVSDLIVRREETIDLVVLSPPQAKFWSARPPSGGFCLTYIPSPHLARNSSSSPPESRPFPAQDRLLVYSRAGPSMLLYAIRGPRLAYVRSRSSRWVFFLPCLVPATVFPTAFTPLTEGSNSNWLVCYSGAKLLPAFPHYP